MDPRDAHGLVHRSARIHDATLASSFGGPLSVNCTTTVHARVKSGDDWSELVVASFVADQDFSQFLITEIMHHPTDLRGTAKNEEFIEFKNIGDAPLDLSGMRLVDFEIAREGFREIYTFPEGVMALPGEFVVLVANPESFLSLYPGVTYDGVIPPGQVKASPFNNALSRIALIGIDGSVATHMRYDSHAPWPAIPDNHGYFRHLPSAVGFSLTRTTLDPKADPEHFSTWRASSARLGSPGSDDPEPKIARLVIHELRSRSNGALLDTVEIYNPTPNEVSIGGWWLSDDRNSPYKFRFPPEMVVPGDGYLVVDELDFSAAGSGLAFNSEDERCYLFSGDSEGELTGYSDGFKFFGSDRDASFGRVESSDGNDYFLMEESPSFGSGNSGPLLPTLMITEIMYHPEAGGFPYIELQNITEDPIQLWDPNYPKNSWVLSPKAEVEKTFSFPLNTTVPPGGYVICVLDGTGSFDVPENVQVFHFSFQDFFATRGSVSLFRPSGMSGNDPRYVIVDQAKYQNMSPWDPGAAGGGQALERMDRNAFGNDPVSWCAGPTGGTMGWTWEGVRSNHSLPEISILTTEGTFKLLFLTELGYRYSLEESSDLDTWRASSAEVIVGDGTHAVFEQSFGDPEVLLFLRLVIAPVGGRRW